MYTIQLHKCTLKQRVVLRIKTDTWKLQILIKREILYMCNIYTRENDIVPFILTSHELSIFCQDEKVTLYLFLHTFKSNNLCPPRWRSGSGLGCGSGDQDSIPGLLSLRVGPLMARRLKTSSDDLVPACGWLGMLKTPSWPWRWVPGSRSKFENWTTVPSLYSWYRAECNVKSQPTNDRLTCACKMLTRLYKF